LISKQRLVVLDTLGYARSMGNDVTPEAFKQLDREAQ
jgi:hypothetical protein